jgi:hypothetical protein
MTKQLSVATALCAVLLDTPHMHRSFGHLGVVSTIARPEQQSNQRPAFRGILDFKKFVVARHERPAPDTAHFPERLRRNMALVRVSI